MGIGAGMVVVVMVMRTARMGMAMIVIIVAVGMIVIVVVVIIVAVSMIVVVVVVIIVAVVVIMVVIMVVIVVIIVAVGMIVVVVVMIVVAMVMTVIMVMRRKSSPLPVFVQDGPFNRHQFDFVGTGCQIFDRPLQPRRQSLTHPDHKIGPVEGLRFRGAHRISMRRSAGPDDQ